MYAEMEMEMGEIGQRWMATNDDGKGSAPARSFYSLCGALYSAVVGRVSEQQSVRGAQQCAGVLTPVHCGVHGRSLRSLARSPSALPFHFSAVPCHAMPMDKDEASERASERAHGDFLPDRSCPPNQKRAIKFMRALDSAAPHLSVQLPTFLATPGPGTAHSSICGRQYGNPARYLRAASRIEAHPPVRTTDSNGIDAHLTAAARAVAEKGQLPPKAGHPAAPVTPITARNARSFRLSSRLAPMTRIEGRGPSRRTMSLESGSKVFFPSLDGGSGSRRAVIMELR
ncbi:hypothetical protein K505DRAFT_343710 [Melanomma pulvis-pyrius CBS 109.77]|uniref:Uncharacterized protein n=1 Tax=Melanomma pulvis-pyrius CBS 109.77 TaxID=1314802 RepID=A0A6A6WRN3_9PLEO|nr:hypothetical protein K505DRAFT_343710 [Melanomma pulvis-pyrius CBS 109.77]